MVVVWDHLQSESVDCGFCWHLSVIGQLPVSPRYHSGIMTSYKHNEFHFSLCTVFVSRSNMDFETAAFVCAFLFIAIVILLLVIITLVICSLYHCYRRLSVWNSERRWAIFHRNCSIELRRRNLENIELDRQRRRRQRRVRFTLPEDNV